MASQNNNPIGTLDSFVEAVQGESHLRIENDYGDGFVRLRTSEAERRQAAQDIQSSEDVVVELLRNARDAGASHIYIATGVEGNERTIIVIDDGAGIPDRMHKMIFEPRVTSKLDSSHMDKWGLHGRGMALYSISQNCSDAQVVSSSPGKGTSISIKTNLAKLPEKTDQSTFPTFHMGEESTVVVRGPKNIARTSCEFAIEEHANCSVYLGSSSEIIATLYAYGSAVLTSIEKAFTKDPQDLVITKRLALATDPHDLSYMAHEIGLSISERTARRIINGSIAPIECILNLVSIDGAKELPKKHVARRKSSAGTTHISAIDRETIQKAALSAFSEVAPQYYLDTDVKAKTSVKNGALVISIPLSKN